MLGELADSKSTKVLTALRPRLGQATYHWAVRLVIAAFLFAAAISKGVRLATDSTAGPDFWDARWFLIPLVLLEGSLALGLLFLVNSRILWFSTVLLFGVFAAFNVVLAIRGERHCPCFGGKEISPAGMTTLDLLTAAAMVACPPVAASRQGRVSRFAGRAYWFVLPFLAIPATLNMVYHSHDGLGLDLRRDRRLAVPVSRVVVKNPSNEELLSQVTEASGLRIEMDENLTTSQPEYGIWALGGPSWSIMLAMAEKQHFPARWDRTADGYRLVVAAPWRGSWVPWAIGGVGLVVAISASRIALRQRIKGVVE